MYISPETFGVFVGIATYITLRIIGAAISKYILRDGEEWQKDQ